MNLFIILRPEVKVGRNASESSFGAKNRHLVSWTPNLLSSCWNLGLWLLQQYHSSFYILHSRSAVIMFRSPDLVTGTPI